MARRGIDVRPASAQAAVLASPAPKPERESPDSFDEFGDGVASVPPPEDPPRTVAYEIQTTTDAVNELLEGAEKALIALNLGTEGEIVVNEFPGGRRTLAFRKTKSGWKLLIEDTGDYGEPAVELLAAAREARIEAAAKLNELLSLLLEESHGRLKRLREAVDHLEAFHARIAQERSAL